MRSRTWLMATVLGLVISAANAGDITLTTTARFGPLGQRIFGTAVRNPPSTSSNYKMTVRATDVDGKFNEAVVGAGNYKVPSAGLTPGDITLTVSDTDGHTEVQSVTYILYDVEFYKNGNSAVARTFEVQGVKVVKSVNFRAHVKNRPKDGASTHTVTALTTTATSSIFTDTIGYVQRTVVKFPKDGYPPSPITQEGTQGIEYRLRLDLAVFLTQHLPITERDPD